MGHLDLQELTQIINYSRTTQIEAEPIGGKDKSWSLHRGIYKVHLSTYPFKVLYLQSGATQEDLRTAARKINHDEETHVIVLHVGDRDGWPKNCSRFDMRSAFLKRSCIGS